MLLEHAELCYRANMSVNWMLTHKQPYLDTLTNAIEIPREAWLMSLAPLTGLEGVSTPPDDTEGYADPAITQAY
eukprot:gene8629-10219_t